MIGIVAAGTFLALMHLYMVILLFSEIRGRFDVSVSSAASASTTYTVSAWRSAAWYSPASPIGSPSHDDIGQADRNSDRKAVREIAPV